VRLTGSAMSEGSHLSKLTVLLTDTLAHEDKDVRKAAGKLLRRCLQALTEIYPTEVRRPMMMMMTRRRRRRRRRMMMMIMIMR
jgi:hypothetical protein